MDWIDFLIIFLLMSTGAVIVAPIAYLFGRNAERRAYRAVWQHLQELHASLNHKSFMVITPKVGVNEVIRKKN